MADPQYLRGYNFCFQIQGVTCGYFSSIQGLGVEVDVIECREGGDLSHVYTLPGLVRYPKITLSWGVTAQNGEMWDWLDGAVVGRVVKKEVAIICLAPDGQAPALRYNINGAWPCSWQGWKFDARTSEAAIEHMTIVAEKMEREALAPAQPEEAPEAAEA